MMGVWLVSELYDKNSADQIYLVYLTTIGMQVGRFEGYIEDYWICPTIVSPTDRDKMIYT